MARNICHLRDLWPCIFVVDPLKFGPPSWHSLSGSYAGFPDQLSFSEQVLKVHPTHPIISTSRSVFIHNRCVFWAVQLGPYLSCAAQPQWAEHRRSLQPTSFPEARRSRQVRARPSVWHSAARSRLLLPRSWMLPKPSFVPADRHIGSIDSQAPMFEKPSERCRAVARSAVPLARGAGTIPTSCPWWAATGSSSGSRRHSSSPKT